MSSKARQSQGIMAALSSAVFLGLAPVFGRWAILSGFSPLAVVTFRTGLAALIMLIIMAIFRRPFLYIFPVGLAGCVLAGSINGFGSVLYYLALGELPASVGQLLYALYPLFVAVFSVLDKQPMTKLTMLRVGMAIVAVVLLTTDGTLNAPLGAIFMMIGSAALYALHIPINQRVLYEIPAPTVTVYTLISMSMVTLPFYLFFDRQLPPSETSWLPVILLTLVTFISRLTLFLGIKKIGGTQTALLGLGELLITIILSHYMLDEKLSTAQMIGAGILFISLLLVRFDNSDNWKRPKGGWLSWLHPPEVKPIPWSLQD